MFAGALALVLVCGWLLWSCQRVRATTSITFDETFYLNCGLQTVHDGRLDSRLAAEGVAPLPILLNYVPALAWQPHAARPEMWTGNPRDRELIGGPRTLNGWLVGVPLLIVAFVWLFRRQGSLVAACGVATLAVSPTIAAHAALATTDLSIALFGFVAMLTIGWYLKRPGFRRMFVLALALAAALSAKYSGVFLLPVAGLMFFFEALSRPEREGEPTRRLVRLRRALGWSLGRYALLMCLLLPLWWGFHGFGFTGPLKNVPLEATPDDSPWVKMLGRGPTADWIMDQAHRVWKRPAPVAGVVFQFLHNQGGHRSFLMGERSETGWWYYFPVAFALKSTPVELLLTLGLFGLFGGVLLHPVRAWRAWDLDRRVMCLAALVLLALVLTARINIGQRYLIVLYPLLILTAFDRLGTLLAGRSKLLAGIGLVLAAGQFASHLSIGTHSLAYFNELAGGPENGWRLLVDSNLDWGQDLPALRDEVERLEGKHVALHYFGTAIPAAYGVEADPLTELTRVSEDYDLLAVSVTALQGMYVGDGDPFAEFRELEPDGRAGYSMHLYRLDTPDRKRRFRRVIAEMVDALARTASRPQP